MQDPVNAVAEVGEITPESKTTIRDLVQTRALGIGQLLILHGLFETTVEKKGEGVRES